MSDDSLSNEADFGGSGEDFDDRLAEIQAKVEAAGERSQRRTSIRLCQEGRRIARRAQKLLPYLHFSFDLFNAANAASEAKLGCDVAVETILLLESIDKAKQFDPKVSEEQYEYTKTWLTGRAYQALAQLTGSLNGYNSPGMHQCIADGLNVCRRTGNLSEIICFREFAVEVYRAADDLDLALHFAYESVKMQGTNINRKVASADDATKLLALQGRLSEAVAMAQTGWKYCNEFHNPYLAKINFLPLAREVFCLAGRRDLLDEFPILVATGASIEVPEEQVIRIPSEEEDPYFQYLHDRYLALEAVVASEFDRGLELLKKWDERFLQQKCLDHWFNIRCRRIATLRLAGRFDEIRPLVKPCEATARKASDWFTLRRLSRLLDDSIPCNPMATLGPPDCGPFAGSIAGSIVGSIAGNAHPGAEGDLPGLGPAGEEEKVLLSLHRSGKTRDAEVSDATNSAHAGSQEDSSKESESTWSMKMAEFESRLNASEGDPDRVLSVVDDLLRIDPIQIEDPDVAVQLMQLLGMLAGMFPDESRALAAIAWGEAIQKRFPKEASVLSTFALLAWRIRSTLELDGPDVISEKQIELLLQRAQDIDPNSDSVFARSGLFYLQRNIHGEAERCFARAFRLNRSSSFIASNLAEVYSQTDRPRDALAVLDMSLREGNEDPGIAWEAALRANGLGQFDVMLTYLDRYDQLAPDQPWTNHYRAFAYLELERPQEALEALDRESACNPESAYNVLLQRTSAEGKLKRLDPFRELLTQLLEFPFRKVETLNPSGLKRLFAQLWNSSSLLDRADPLKDRLRRHLLSACLASDELFDSYRLPDDPAQTPTGSVRFYRVLLKQPLDAQWQNSVGCLANEEAWTSYDICWGVLANDEEEAKAIALASQSICYPLPAEVLAVEESDEDYADFPGVVSQGPRIGDSPETNDSTLSDSES